MDTLQIALVMIGFVCVAAIIAFNKWQEGKHRSRADRAFPGERRDPLLERDIDTDTGPVAGRSPDVPHRKGGGHASEETGEYPGAAQGKKSSRSHSGFSSDSSSPMASLIPLPPLPPRRRTYPPLPDKLDPRLDCCIRIEAVEPIEVPRLWAAQAEVFDNISRTLRWYAFDDQENQWRRINANTVGAHHWYLAALQLVDREGMIHEGDFMRYTHGVQRLADQFRAVPAGIPSRVEMMGNAKALDRFCAEVDVQIAINIVSEQPMTGSRISSLAEAEGLRLESDGSFHARAADSRTLYILSNGEPALFERSELPGLQTRHLSLVLDLPRVLDAAGEFEDMMRFASHLAKMLDAAVVDDNGRAFGTESIDAIRARIRSYQVRMSEEGIPPGGSVARRLFGS
ncbi:MAG: ZipA [Azoarcus sp.]|jgi:FtsZ-interacting cell division protein ZipA|nr:ZipA [Azoarcus sp.]